MRIQIFIALASSIFFLFGCSHFGGSSKVEQKAEPYWSVVVGVDGGNRALQILIGEVLIEKGIESGMGGSVLYDVFVPSDRLAEARKVLQEDPRLKEQILFLPFNPTRR